MALSDLVYIDAAGFHWPDFPTLLASLQADYRTIYGQDVYLGSDSQDGQWVAIQAQAFYDTFAKIAQVHAGFSPSSATGVLLSSNVKINGITRKTASYSSVDLRIVGQAGTVITNGSATDAANNTWNLPASVTIPPAGEITVTATAAVPGAVAAAAGSITRIGTPTLGWQTVSNPAAATPGAPVESDSELRIRQRVSVALPSLSVFEGTIGAVANVPGVTRYRGYENDTDTTDANGIPRKSISLVVEGGDVAAIAQAIAGRKTPGTGTFGTTSQTVYDKYGTSNTIRFFRPTAASIQVQIIGTANAGYSAATGALIRDAVLAHINSLGIAASVNLLRLAGQANLPGTPAYGTFSLTQVRLGKNGGALAASDIPLAFNEVAKATQADISVVIS